MKTSIYVNLFKNEVPEIRKLKYINGKPYWSIIIRTKQSTIIISTDVNPKQWFEEKK